MKIKANRKKRIASEHTAPAAARKMYNAQNEHMREDDGRAAAAATEKKNLLAITLQGKNSPTLWCMRVIHVGNVVVCVSFCVPMKMF